VAVSALELVTAIALLAGGPAQAAAPPADPGACVRPAYEHAVACVIDELRARHGLAPLRWSARLATAAGRHSADMVARRYFKHFSAPGVGPAARARRVGYTSATAPTTVGEAAAWAAWGDASVREVVQAWMDSPPHKEVLLLRAARDVGIGSATGLPLRGGGSGVTVTLLVGRRGV
jgi:uncharacterized protein YkwD